MNNSELIANVAIAFITTLVTGTFALWGFWRKAKAELEQEYLSRFNAKKWEVYTEFTKLLQSMPIDKSTDLSGVAQQSAEIAIASQLVLIGSDEVVGAFRGWRETSMAYGRSHAIAKEKLFELVVKMRNDLGIKYSKLGIEDLLGALEPGFSKP